MTHWYFRLQVIYVSEQFSLFTSWQVKAEETQNNTEGGLKIKVGMAGCHILNSRALQENYFQ
jgi:hypothetical protein